MTIVLEKSNIPKLTEALSRQYLVVDYEKDKTALSVKGYFLAPRGKLFSFFSKTKKLSVHSSPKRKLLLFGLDLADIEALGGVGTVESPDRRLHELHGLADLLRGRLLERAEVAVDRGHDVARGVRVLVEDQEGLRASREQTRRQFHQVHARPHAGRSRRNRGRGHGPRDP